MTPEYIIMTSQYSEADRMAKQLDLETGTWNWIRDRFKEPIVYKRLEVK